MAVEHGMAIAATGYAHVRAHQREPSPPPPPVGYELAETVYTCITGSTFV
jgi:hypothetical protein